MFIIDIKLNADKTEITLFGPFSNSIQTFPSSFDVQGSTIKLSTRVRNLGCTRENQLKMEPQICNAKQKAIGNLINIARIGK